MTPDDFRKLAAAGLNTEQIALVMEMMEAGTKAAVEEALKPVESGREKARARWHKWKETQRSNVGQREQTFANDSKRLVRADKNISNSTDTNLSKKTSHTQSDVAAFRSALAGDVDGETLDEFIKVRRKKRGALTAFAAKLFREDAAACSMTVEVAARECVRSSWVTVKPEYFASRQRAGPSPKPNKFTELANAIGASNGQAGFGTTVTDDFDAGRSLSSVEYRRFG